MTECFLQLVQECFYAIRPPGTIYVFGPDEASVRAEIERQLDLIYARQHLAALGFGKKKA